MTVDQIKQLPFSFSSGYIPMSSQKKRNILIYVQCPHNKLDLFSGNIHTLPLASIVAVLVHLSATS